MSERVKDEDVDFDFKHCRPRDRKVVFPANKELVKYQGFLPCDKDGNFITGLDAIPEVPEKPVVQSPATDDQGDIPELIERAKQLGIKATGRMKRDTLIARIAEAESAKAEGGSSE